MPGKTSGRRNMSAMIERWDSKAAEEVDRTRFGELCTAGAKSECVLHLRHKYGIPQPPLS